MRQETFTLSQKELQRVSVISACLKGDLACASAAELLSLSVRHIKRLKKRLREAGEAALAHANRGRPSHRRLPERTRQAVLRLGRSKYPGFNDHHLCEKLCEVEGFSLARETLRRLLRQEGLGSPRKRRAPAHRQRRLCSPREGELLQLDGSPHDWLEGRGPAKAWRPAPEQLERICAFRHERIVSNDNVVQWEGRRFQIPHQNRRFTFAGAKIQLYQALDGRVSLYFGETRLEHTNTTGG